MHSNNQTIAKKDIVTVHLLTGKDMEDKPVYVYLSVLGSNLEALRESLDKGEFRPTDFGIILASGSGVPPEEIQQRMEKEYGFDHASPLICETKAEH